MKVISISGRNLASLESFSIELANGPLAQVGIFAISGPTGAGKSTILDALCLALYDKFPRLTNTSRVPVGLSGDEMKSRLMSNDPRSILRRGCTGGFAEVVFKGVDGFFYRSRWEVQAPKRKSKSLKIQEMSLVNLETDELLGRTKTEVLAAIREKVGLTFDQFRRSVLLAQGDFAAFLTANSDQRAELLERMTGTELYSKISILSHARAEAEKNNLHELEARSEEHQVLVEEERQNLEQNRIEAEKILQKISQAAALAKAEHEWHIQLGQLQAHQAELEKAFAQTAQNLLESKPLEKELAEFEQAQPLMSLVKQLDILDQDQAALFKQKKETKRKHESIKQEQQEIAIQLEKATGDRDLFHKEIANNRPLKDKALQLDTQQNDIVERTVDLQAQLKESKEQCSVVEQKYHALSRQVDACTQKQAKITKFLKENEPIAPLAQQWQVYLVELHSYVDALANQQSVFAAVSSLEKNRTKGREDLDILGREKEQLEKQLIAYFDELNKAQEKLKKLDLQGLRLKNNELLQKKNILAQRLQLKRDWLKVVQEQQGKDEDIAQKRARVQELASVIDEATSRRGQEANFLAEAERGLKIAQIQAGESVQELRSALQDEEPCPVCGSHEHPYAHRESPSQSVVQEQEQRVHALRSTIMDLTRKIDLSSGEREQLDGRIKELRQECEEMSRSKASVEQAYSDLSHASDTCSFAESITEEKEDVLELEMDQLDTELSDLDRLNESGDKLGQEITSKRQEEDRLRAKLATLQQLISAQSEQAQVLEVGLSEKSKEGELYTKRLNDLEKKIKPLLAWQEMWQQKLGQEGKALIGQLDTRVQHFLSRQVEENNLQEQINALHPQVVEAKSKGTAFQQRVQQLSEDLNHLLKMAATLKQDRAALFGGKTLAEVEDEEQQTLERLNRFESTLKDKHSGHTEKHVELNTNLSSLGERLEQISRQRESSKKEFANLLLQRNLTDEKVRTLLDHDETWCNTVREKLAKINSEHDQLQGRMLEVRTRLQGHKESLSPQYSEKEAKDALDNLLKEEDTAGKVLFEYNLRLKQDNEAREKLAQLGEEHRAQKKKTGLWLSIKDLIGSHDGKKFRTFAQSLTLENLLAYANSHLKEINQRYFLQRVPGTDLDIQVVDRDMGDEVRSVNTLSGGESFLVSLALALGLASLSAEQTQIESLFIDEGFGSLDAESLEIALDALSALYAQGRQVGVISHVQTLIERIGTHVRLEKRNNGKSIIVMPEITTY